MEATFLGYNHPEDRDQIVISDWEADGKWVVSVRGYEDQQTYDKQLNDNVISEAHAGAFLDLDEAELLGKSILALVANLRARPKGA